MQTNINLVKFSYKKLHKITIIQDRKYGVSYLKIKTFLFNFISERTARNVNVILFNTTNQ